MTLKKFRSGALTVLSVLLGLIWLAPLVWLIGTALTEPSFNMSFIPNTPFTTDNLTYVWNAIPFGQYYLNTIILVVVTFAIQFVTSTLAGYAMAFYNFKGQALMFVVIFMQIIIPNDVLIIPNFMTLSEMGLIDTKLGIMAPFLGSALAIFLLRQHFNRSPCLWRSCQNRRCQPAANHLAGIHALRKGRVYVLCSDLGQLPLEQLSLAAHRNQVSYKPHPDRGAGHLCQVQRGRHAVGQRLCRNPHHYCALVAGILHHAKAVHEQLRQRRREGVTPCWT